MTGLEKRAHATELRIEIERLATEQDRVRAWAAELERQNVDLVSAAKVWVSAEPQ